MTDVTRADVEAVLDQIDHDGLQNFLAEHPQFGLPKQFWFVSGGRPGRVYPTKPVSAVALGWPDINGGYSQRDSACNVLERAGYTITDRQGVVISKSELDEAFADVAEIEGRGDLDRTTREQLINARLGQGRFRTDLRSRWDSRCALTGMTTEALLRASHVKPWRHSSDRQRLDGANGLLLAAHVDALFDRYLLTFDQEGKLIWSDKVCNEDRQLLGFPDQLRRAPTEDERKYLALHRVQIR